MENDEDLLYGDIEYELNSPKFELICSWIAKW